MVLVAAVCASAWENSGVVHGTGVEYSNLAVSKSGVNVTLTNTEEFPVKISLRLNFYDRNGNSIGYSLFGLREIEAGGKKEIVGNYLNGKWKTCRDAFRMEWQKMTYDVLY